MCTQDGRCHNFIRLVWTLVNSLFAFACKNDVKIGKESVCVKLK